MTISMSQNVLILYNQSDGEREGLLQVICRISSSSVKYHTFGTNWRGAVRVGSKTLLTPDGVQRSIRIRRLWHVHTLDHKNSSLPEKIVARDSIFRGRFEDQGILYLVSIIRVSSLAQHATASAIVFGDGSPGKTRQISKSGLYGESRRRHKNYRTISHRGISGSICFDSLAYCTFNTLTTLDLDAQRNRVCESHWPAINVRKDHRTYWKRGPVSVQSGWFMQICWDSRKEITPQTAPLGQ